jgi:hypothetical protein
LSDVSLLRLWGLDESLLCSRSLLRYSFLVVSPCCLPANWCFELNYLFSEYADGMHRDLFQIYKSIMRDPRILAKYIKSNRSLGQPRPSYPKSIIAKIISIHIPVSQSVSLADTCPAFMYGALLGQTYPLPTHVFSTPITRAGSRNLQL